MGLDTAPIIYYVEEHPSYIRKLDPFFDALNRDFITYPVSDDIAEEAARLRSVYNLDTPDAIQLAPAKLRRATHFLTNDSRLRRVEDLRVPVLDKLD